MIDDLPVRTACVQVRSVLRQMPASDVGGSLSESSWNAYAAMRNCCVGTISSSSLCIRLPQAQKSRKMREYTVPRDLVKGSLEMYTRLSEFALCIKTSRPPMST